MPRRRFPLQKEDKEGKIYPRMALTKDEVVALREDISSLYGRLKGLGEDLEMIDLDDEGAYSQLTSILEVGLEDISKLTLDKLGMTVQNNNALLTLMNLPSEGFPFFSICEWFAAYFISLKATRLSSSFLDHLLNVFIDAGRGMLGLFILSDFSYGHFTVDEGFPPLKCEAVLKKERRVYSEHYHYLSLFYFLSQSEEGYDTISTYASQFIEKGKDEPPLKEEVLRFVSNILVGSGEGLRKIYARDYQMMEEGYRNSFIYLYLNTLLLGLSEYETPLSSFTSKERKEILIATIAQMSGEVFPRGFISYPGYKSALNCFLYEDIFQDYGEMKTLLSGYIYEAYFKEYLYRFGVGYGQYLILTGLDGPTQFISLVNRGRDFPIDLPTYLNEDDPILLRYLQERFYPSLEVEKISKKLKEIDEEYMEVVSSYLKMIRGEEPLLENETVLERLIHLLKLFPSK